MSKRTNNKSSNLNEIPSDWKILPLSSLGSFSKGKGILKEQVIKSGLPCIRYGEIYTTHDFILKEFKSFISEDVAAESKEIKNGDILFAGSGETLEDIGKAVAYVGNEKAYAGGDVIILSTNKKVNTEWLSYILESDFVRRQKRRLGQGQSVVHIYPSDLATLNIPYPPEKEQESISKLLDLTDTTIKKSILLIEKKNLQKKWLMEKLLNKKSIAKNKKWCKSGLRKVTVGEVSKIFSGGTPSRRSPEYFKGDIPWIKSGEVNDFEIFDTEEKITSEAVTDSSTKILEANTILLALYGATAGVVGITRIKAAINQAVLAIIPDEKQIDKMYLLRCLQFHMPKALENFVQGGQPNLSGGIIFSLQFSIVNSLEEQKAIAKALQVADNEIKILKARTDKLREKKKGLMQILLIGKKRLLQ